MSKLFLITTPITETWDFNQNTLMLGNWCNTLEKKKDIEKLKKNQILKYHWSDPKKVFKITNTLITLQKKF